MKKSCIDAHKTAFFQPFSCQLLESPYSQVRRTWHLDTPLGVDVKKHAFHSFWARASKWPNFIIHFVVWPVRTSEASEIVTCSRLLFWSTPPKNCATCSLPNLTILEKKTNHRIIAVSMKKSCIDTHKTAFFQPFSCQLLDQPIGQARRACHHIRFWA